MTINNQFEREENQHALKRRGVIVWTLAAAFIVICALGVYFGLFIGFRVAGGG